MKKIAFSLAITIAYLFLTSCGGGTRNKDLQPRASGKAGEIIMVVDTVHRNTELGNELDQILRKQVAGLPRPEPEFNVRYVLPEEFNEILKMARNIIIVAVLDNYSSNSERVKNYFTPNSIKIINEDPEKFYLSKQNEWARGQEVLFLFGRTEEDLVKNLKENKNFLKDHFNGIEKRRLEASLYKAKEMKEVSSVLLDNHQYSLRMPFGWRIEFQDEDSPFTWLRLPGIDVDKNIWVYYEDYESEDIFEDIAGFRNRVTKEFIFDDKDDNDTSYVVVETLIPPVTRRIYFNDKFAVEARGLWKTNNLSMGGPFLSYIFVDPELNRIYYLDGFVYSPSKPQREYIRELETIMWTFQTESEIPSS